ncbi:hypothetical protein OAP83_02315, partial [Rickettsiales bacterium]|nr:hypothetical protein [Rickettsiales bacterium]
TKELIKHDYKRQLDAVKVLHDLAFKESTFLNHESAEYKDSQAKLELLHQSKTELKNAIDGLDDALVEGSDTLQLNYTRSHLGVFADVNEDDISDKMYFELLAGYRQLSFMISSNMHKDIMGLHEDYLLSIAMPEVTLASIKDDKSKVADAKKAALKIIQTENPVKKYHDLIKESEVVESSLDKEIRRLATNLGIDETDESFEQASQLLSELKLAGVEDKDSQKAKFDEQGLGEFYRYARIEANFCSKNQDLKDHVEIYADAIKSYNDFVSKGEVVKSIADIYDYDVDHSKAVCFAANIIGSSKGNLDDLISLTLALKESTFLLKSEQLDEFFKGTNTKSNAQLKDSFLKDELSKITANALGGDDDTKELKVRNKMRQIGSEFRKYKEKFGQDFRENLRSQGKLDQLRDLKLLEVFSLVRNFLEDHLDQNELTQEQKTKLSYSTDQLKVHYPNGVLYDQEEILSSSLTFNPSVDLSEYVTQVLSSLRVKHENVKQKHTKEAESLTRIQSSINDDQEQALQLDDSPIREAAVFASVNRSNGLDEASIEGERDDVSSDDESSLASKEASVSSSSSTELRVNLGVSVDLSSTYPDVVVNSLIAGEEGNPLQREQVTISGMVRNVADFTGLGTLPPTPPVEQRKAGSVTPPPANYDEIPADGRFGGVGSFSPSGKQEENDQIEATVGGNVARLTNRTTPVTHGTSL